ncbi:MAG: mechanosensitive ion channel, partial [Actinobacteria bacterium]|nr:mechanosensitive ion channel [Actinomycetota bacterium]
MAIVATLHVAAAKDDGWWVTLWDWVIGTPLEIFATIVIAFILQKALGWIIRRVVLRTSERARRERLEQTRKVTRTAELSVILLTQRTEQRAAAIGSLLSSIITITVWGVAIIVILEALSVDIAPLLASAGVIGVILGFGAQTLIKDYLSGIFIILEDQFGVG